MGKEEGAYRAIASVVTTNSVTYARAVVAKPVGERAVHRTRYLRAVISTPSTKAHAARKGSVDAGFIALLCILLEDVACV